MRVVCELLPDAVELDGIGEDVLVLGLGAELDAVGFSFFEGRGHHEMPVVYCTFLLIHVEVAIVEIWIIAVEVVFRLGISTCSSLELHPDHVVASSSHRKIPPVPTFL